MSRNERAEGYAGRRVRRTRVRPKTPSEDARSPPAGGGFPWLAVTAAKGDRSEERFLLAADRRPSLPVRLAPGRPAVEGSVVRALWIGRMH